MLTHSSDWPMVVGGFDSPIHIHTYIYIYIDIIDCGESDSMIEICWKLDKSNT